MSRLSDLYKAMETLRKEGLSLNEDLEKQVSDLEENIIKKEILPIVTETIAPALKARLLAYICLANEISQQI